MSETTDNALQGEAAAEPVAPDTGTTATPETAATETKEPDEPKPKEDPVEKRIARLTARNYAIQRERDELEARLAALERAARPADKQDEPTPADFHRSVREEAEKLVKAETFNRECDRVAELGAKEFPDFNSAIGSLWPMLGGFKPDLVEAALEAGNAHKVLYALSQDPDEAERIAKLPPNRMGAAIAKLAAAPPPAAPAPKPVSKAPAPIKPITGAAKAEFNEHTATAQELVAYYMRKAKA